MQVYIGTGKPVITVYDSTGDNIVLGPITLRRPSSNVITLESNFSLEKNIEGEWIKKYTDVNREYYECKISYGPQMLTQSEINTLLQIFSLERSGHKIYLQPRSDNSTVKGWAALKEDPVVTYRNNNIKSGVTIDATFLLNTEVLGYSQTLPDSFDIYDSNWLLDDDYSEMGVYPTTNGSTLYGGVSRCYVGNNLVTVHQNAKLEDDPATVSDGIIFRKNVVQAGDLASNIYESEDGCQGSSYVAESLQQHTVLTFYYKDKLHTIYMMPPLVSTLPSNYQFSVYTCDFDNETGFSERTNTANRRANSNHGCLSVYEITSGGVTVYDGYNNTFWVYDYVAFANAFNFSQIAGLSVNKGVCTGTLYFVTKEIAIEVDSVNKKIYLVSIKNRTVIARKELPQPQFFDGDNWIVDYGVAIAGGAISRASTSTPVVLDMQNKRLRVMFLLSEGSETPYKNSLNIKKICSWSYKLS